MTNYKKSEGHWLDGATEKLGFEKVEEIKSLLKVLLLFVPIPLFWALFRQLVISIIINQIIIIIIIVCKKNETLCACNKKIENCEQYVLLLE